MSTSVPRADGDRGGCVLALVLAGTSAAIIAFCLVFGRVGAPPAPATVVQPTAPAHPPKPSPEAAWTAAYWGTMARELNDGRADVRRAVAVEQENRLPARLLSPAATPAQRASAVDLCRGLLADPDPEVRVRAAGWLLALAPPAKWEDIPAACQPLLDHPDPGVRVRAAVAMWRAGGAAGGVVLTNSVQDGAMSEDLRMRAVRAADPERLPPGMADSLVGVAGSSAEPLALRVKAIAALRPQRTDFRERHPDMAAMIDRAVGYPAEDRRFRAFCAHFLTPDSVERFASIVRVLAISPDEPKPFDPQVAIVRRVLASHLARLSAEAVSDGWLTDGVLADLAAASGQYRSPRVEPGFGPDGEPWGVVPEGQGTAAAFDEQARRWLVRGGMAAVPHLTRHLLHPYAGVRNLKALAEFGPDAPDAVPAVLALFDPAAHTTLPEHERKAARLTAVAFLAKLGPRAEDAAEPLARELAAAEYTADERSRLCEAYVQVGGDLTTRLIALLRSDHPPVRAWAAAQLGKLGPDAREAVSPLVDAVRADTTNDWAVYAKALGQIGPDSVPGMKVLLADREERLRIVALNVLAYIGPECRSVATPLLRTVIKGDKSDEVRATALEALGEINPTEASELGWSPQRSSAPSGQSDPLAAALQREIERRQQAQASQPYQPYRYSPPVIVPFPVLRGPPNPRPAPPAVRPRFGR